MHFYVLDFLPFWWPLILDDKEFKEEYSAVDIIQYPCMTNPMFLEVETGPEFSSRLLFLFKPLKQVLQWLKPIVILPVFLPWTSKSIASVNAFTELYRHFLCLQGFIDFFPHLSTLPFTTRNFTDPLFLQFSCFTPWNVFPFSFLLLQNSLTYSTFDNSAFWWTVSDFRG